ncbi:MAG: type II toxin-antitoxin system RnlB family antitoxin [Alicyclobacillus sp.]|nr:type II toxin-antitoxin system RnlB family antitoxin [Alicyclobacillus sp.]
MDSLGEISNDLNGKFHGRVLFDLLLSNGNASNRFLEAEFDGKKFDFRSFKIAGTVDDTIKKLASGFYKEHSDFLDDSILPRHQKFLIKKGVCL